eukprot:gene19522-biopygen8475
MRALCARKMRAQKIAHARKRACKEKLRKSTAAGSERQQRQAAAAVACGGGQRRWRCRGVAQRGTAQRGAAARELFWPQTKAARTCEMR